MGRVRLPRFKSAPVLAKSSPPFFFVLTGTYIIAYRL